MNFPEDLKYSKEHTWVKIEGELAIIGITEFAQSELGEIVYVDISSVNKRVKQNEVIGIVEALKTVSDLYMPVSGVIIEENKKNLKNPTLVNTDSYSEGWIIKAKWENLEELNQLLSAEKYKSLTGN